MLLRDSVQYQDYLYDLHLRTKQLKSEFVHVWAPHIPLFHIRMMSIAVQILSSSLIMMIQVNVMYYQTKNSEREKR